MTGTTTEPMALASRGCKRRLRWVGHLDEARIAHLEHAHLVSGAKAVLFASQCSVGAKAAAFQVEHGVDHVLQRSRAGQVAILGNVARDQD